jgi:hypothetical protein
MSGISPPEMGEALEQPGLPDEPDAPEPAAEPSAPVQDAVADGSDLLEERGQGAGRLLGAGAEQAFTADEGQEGRGSEEAEGTTE